MMQIEWQTVQTKIRLLLEEQSEFKEQSELGLINYPNTVKHAYEATSIKGSTVPVVSLLQLVNTLKKLSI